ncbi:hypothetical protein SH528x_005901 [Novipirellula sp. SH528]|uniref:hypothetical protein n=1 Tax=Novipirellula sp. SH528 TaxID=3454466 RepID=UPI003FA0D4FB
MSLPISVTLIIHGLLAVGELVFVADSWAQALRSARTSSTWVTLTRLAFALDYMRRAAERVGSFT